MDEVIKLRNRILKDTGFDFFTVSDTISGRYVRKADQMLRVTAYKNHLSDFFADET